MNGLNRLAFCILATITLAPSGCTSISPDGDEPEETSSQDEHTGEVTQALVGVRHKLCSAVFPGNWRDTMVVPNSWSASTCARWASSQSATDWQLACSFTNNFSWGGFNGTSVPSPNCGW